MFRTELTIQPSAEKITHQNKILTIGSCFSQVIGDRLYQNKFNTLVNPFGTVFNPISIVRLLEATSTNDFQKIDCSLESQGAWFNYHVHSELYGNTKEELNVKVENTIAEAHSSFLEVDTLIITLGTAFVYRLNSTGEIVANCHKVPSANFSKELLTVQEILSSFASLLTQWKSERPKLRIVLTVSPVRHTRDTLALNNLSKSILRLACHELCETYSNVVYFPAYEIMLDDLRDYRFYKEDMIHPTEVAEEYIWNKFSDAYFNESTKQLLQEWSSIYKALQHKPFRQESEEYKKFLRETLKRLELLKGKMEVGEEIEGILNKL